VLLVLGLWPVSRSNGEPTTSVSPFGPTSIAVNKKAVLSAILDRLRLTGSFNHPACPLVIRAREVRGDTLYFVEFMRRKDDCKSFDFVGKAVSATLALSPEPRENLHDTINLRVRQVDVQFADGAELLADFWFIDIPLPARMWESGYQSHREAKALLTEDQWKALAKDYSLRPEQKVLLAAFGKDGYDLLDADLVRSESGRTLLAIDEHQGEKLDSGSRYRLKRLAVLRFDKEGKLQTHFRGSAVIVDADELSPLIVGDDSKPLTVQGADKQKFILPGIKGGR
jgi:hypothetical protein